MDAAFKIVVVIPTFRPESPVGPLARAAAHQAMEVVVVDDGTAAPLDELPEGVHMIFCRENRGIASALNAGVGRAMELGATHVLTLDQDSMIDGDFVPDMRDNWVAAESLGLRPGVMAPDSVGNVVYRGIRRGFFRDVKEVLQSGSMFSLSALDEVGGFDESLVIDGVDTEVCLQLRLRGWDVLTCPLRMEHQLGNAVVIRLAGLMYGMDSLLYHRIESFVNLPGVRQVSGPSQRGLASKKPSTQSPPFDLNIADSAALESVYGIGGVLARRIVQFRDKLGGFVSFEQLREVYHLDSLAIVQLRKRSFIAPNFQPKKIAVNLASVIELGRHPYIKFKLANALVTYRLQHGNFRHPEDLLQVALMKPENLQRLLPYLTLE